MKTEVGLVFDGGSRVSGRRPMISRAGIPSCQSGPDRRRVPGIVAPDSWGARGAAGLPRRLPPTLASGVRPRDAITARGCLFHGPRSGTTDAASPGMQCSSGASWGSGGFMVPRGQFWAGFSELQQFFFQRKKELTPIIFWFNTQGATLLASRYPQETEMVTR